MPSMIININTFEAHTVRDFASTLVNGFKPSHITSKPEVVKAQVAYLINRISNNLTGNDTLYLYTPILHRPGYSILAPDTDILHTLQTEICKMSSRVFQNIKYIVHDVNANELRLFTANNITKAGSTSTVYITSRTFASGVSGFVNLRGSEPKNVLEGIIELLKIIDSSRDKMIVKSLQEQLDDMNTNSAFDSAFGNALEEITKPRDITVAKRKTVNTKIDNAIAIDYDLLKLLLR